MAEVKVSLLQMEIEEAVKDYISSRVCPGYRFDFTEMDVTFEHTADGRVICNVTATVSKKVEA